MIKRRRSPLWRDWTSILIQEGPEGVVCIQKPGNEYLEFPGGKRRHGTDRRPEVTAVRENGEETGICLAPSEIMLVGRKQEFNHRKHTPWVLYVYRAELTSEKLTGHFVLSKEGEKVVVLPWSRLNQVRFSQFHRHVAEELGLWRKA